MTKTQMIYILLATLVIFSTVSTVLIIFTYKKFARMSPDKKVEKTEGINPERFTYDEIKQDIAGDYQKFMQGGYKLTFYAATAKIIDDLQRVHKRSEVEKFMMYIVLAEKGLENDELSSEIKNEVLGYIKENEWMKFKEQLSVKEIVAISGDVERLKGALLKD